MKVFLVVEKDDTQSTFSEMVRCLKELPKSPKIFLLPGLVNWETIFGAAIEDIEKNRDDLEDAFKH